METNLKKLRMSVAKSDFADSSEDRQLIGECFMNKAKHDCC